MKTRAYATMVIPCLLLTLAGSFAAMAKVTTLRFVVNTDKLDPPAFREVASRYQKLHPDVKIVIEPIAWDDYSTKITLQIAAGKAPDMAYNWPAKGFLPWYGGGMLADLEALLKQDKSFDVSDLSPSGMADQTYPLGGLIGLPLDIAYTALAYNKTYIMNAGLAEPYDLDIRGEWDLSRFLDTAKRLTKDTNGDGKPEIWGFATNPTWEGFFLSALWANGADVVSKDRRTCLLDSPEAIQAIDLFVRKMIWEYKVSPQGAAWFGPGMGMTVMHQAGLEELKMTAEKAKFSYDYALFPKLKHSASRVSTGGISIFRKTKNLAQAWDFAKYLLSDQVQLLRANMTGRIPTRTSLLSKYTRTMPMAKDSGSHLPDVLNACMAIAKPTPYTPNYKDWMDVLTTQYFAKVSTNKATAAQLASATTKQVNTILARTKWRDSGKK